MSPCRRGHCASTRTRPLQAPPLSTFAGRVLNTAPFDPVLELSCPLPPLPGTVRAIKSSSAAKDFLSPCCNRLTAPPFRLRPSRTTATNVETRQLGYGPG